MKVFPSTDRLLSSIFHLILINYNASIILHHALWVWFEQRGQQSDLDNSVLLLRQVIELCPPPHPNRSSFLHTFANALQSRFWQGNQQNNLDKSITLYRQALELCPLLHPNQYRFSSSLAHAVLIWFERTGQKNDLDKSVLLYRQALELCPLSHESLSGILGGLPGMSLFLAATQCISQSAYDHFQIAKTWIHHADIRHKHSSAIDAYDAALQALHQLAAFSLNIQSCWKALTDGSDGLARDASKCAIQTKKYRQSIREWENYFLVTTSITSFTPW